MAAYRSLPFQFNGNQGSFRREAALAVSNSGDCFGSIAASDKRILSVCF
jgi:hypothetical protein